MRIRKNPLPSQNQMIYPSMNLLPDPSMDVPMNIMKSISIVNTIQPTIVMHMAMHATKMYRTG